MTKIIAPPKRQVLRATVTRQSNITPNLVCVTIAGPDLAEFAYAGNDQFARFFFLRDGQTELWMPTSATSSWYAQYLLTPAAKRPHVRNYTIRNFRPEQSEIDIEFVAHGDTGPASAWASTAHVDEPVGLVVEGTMYQPVDHAEWQLLVGDESALPAIVAILEQAPRNLVAEVFLEIPTSDDIRYIDTPDAARIHWLPRNSLNTTVGSLAATAVADAELPSGTGYCFVAGESSLATGIRRHLAIERGIPKAHITFTGYWKRGRSSPG